MIKYEHCSNSICLINYNIVSDIFQRLIAATAVGTLSLQSKLSIFYNLSIDRENNVIHGNREYLGCTYVKAYFNPLFLCAVTNSKVCSKILCCNNEGLKSEIFHVNLNVIKYTSVKM